MNIETIFRKTIATVAEACGVNHSEVTISYSVDDEPEIGDAVNWTVGVSVLNPRARKYKSTFLSEHASTLDEAAELVIAYVAGAVGRGEYKTRNGLSAQVQDAAAQQAREEQIDTFMAVRARIGKPVTREEAAAAIDGG